LQSVHAFVYGTIITMPFMLPAFLQVALGAAITVIVGYWAYVRFYLVRFRNSRDFTSISDRQPSIQLIAEAFDLLRTNRGVIDDFEKLMYGRVANGELPLKGKTVVITGATKGIGRATAAHLAAFGATLILPCRRYNAEDIRKQVEHDAQEAFNKHKPLDCTKTRLDYVACLKSSIVTSVILTKSTPSLNGTRVPAFPQPTSSSTMLA